MTLSEALLELDYYYCQDIEIQTEPLIPLPLMIFMDTGRLAAAEHCVFIDDTVVNVNT